MDTFLALDARLTAAFVAALVSLIVSIPGVVLSIFRYRNDNYLARRTEQAVRSLLTLNGPFVPFRIIAHHVGGYSSSQLRQILVRSGALRFADQNMVEHWALLDSLSREQRASISMIQAPVAATQPQHKLFQSASKEDE